jgi:predicted adenine nucleotide alpha hydrolase (AANH) superfamily ATPase
LIPLLIAVFYYFYTNINQPIGALVKGSERIRKGEYGYCVEPFHKNEEIGQLVDTFNHMSVSLEDSFNRIYVEEIAEREGVKWLPSDFKKRDGFKASLRRSAELGLYRQSYCGCEFSKPHL